MRVAWMWTLLLLMSAALCSACEGGGGGPAPSLDEACGAFCAAMTVCNEADGGTSDAAKEAECVEDCEAGLGLETPPTPSEIQACANGPLATCDTIGTIQCFDSEDALALILELASTACAKPFECCGTPSEGAFLETEEDCTVFVGGMMWMSISEGQEAGYLTVDTGKLSTCVDATQAVMDGLSCEDTPELAMGDFPCDDFMIGLQGEGEPCEIVEEDGLSASSDSYCAGALVCAEMTEDAIKTCAEGVPLGGAGDDSFFAVGPPCLDDMFCSQDGVCTERLADGQECHSDDDCVSENCNGESICEAEGGGLCDGW
jgi:hypothetical protein